MPISMAANFISKHSLDGFCLKKIDSYILEMNKHMWNYLYNDPMLSDSNGYNKIL